MAKEPSLGEIKTAQCSERVRTSYPQRGGMGIYLK